MRQLTQLKEGVKQRLGWMNSLRIGFSNYEVSEVKLLSELKPSDVPGVINMPGTELCNISENHRLFYEDRIPQDDLISVVHSIRTLNKYFDPEVRLDLHLKYADQFYTLYFYVTDEAYRTIKLNNRDKRIIEYFNEAGLSHKLEMGVINNQTFEERVIY